MDFYKVTNPSITNNDNAFWYKLCNCCPYGYHIDLDFVNYCNSLEHVDHTASMKRRKDRRRQRRSMVVLLGLEDLSTVNHTLKKESNVVQNHLELLQEDSSLEIVHMVHEDLNDAVLDFEQTLRRSKKQPKKQEYASLSKIQETIQPSAFSVSATPLKMTMPQNTSQKSGGRMDQDLNSPSCGLVPADLQNIREQMALSLERTKIVEELVKHIPLLQAQLAELKEEKRQLQQQIKINKEEHIFKNGHVHSGLSSSLSKPFPPHLKDCGVTCSLLSPTVVAEAQHIKSYEGSVYADKWFKEKSIFLNDTCGVPSFDGSTIHRKSEIINVTKETQTTLPRSKKDSGIQTITEPPSIKDVVDNKKLYRSVGMSACAHTTDSSTEPLLTTMVTIGISDDTTDTILCNKCVRREVAHKNVATSQNQFTNEVQNRTIGCQSSINSKHVSVQYEPSNKLVDNAAKIKANVSTNTEAAIVPKKTIQSIGCQHEYTTLHKTSQVDLKLKDKAIQYDTPFEVITSENCSKCNANRNNLTTSVDMGQVQPTSKVSLSSLTVTRSKSFCAFETSERRTIGCQYEPVNIHKASQALPKVKHKHTQSESDTPYFTKFKTKLGSKATTYERQASLEEENGTTPSRIPRLQTMPETKRLQRQDTYSVDLSKTGFMLVENVTQEKQNNLESVPDDTHPAPSSLSTIPSLSDAQLNTHSERKKAVPSKSMRAALKVLSDCLSKGQTENLEDQLKNSINIVQLEWFKISSLIDANPLDVDDYLDFFEDFSLHLLRYIVNMVDANGNTAMHYAVSHGNFDVVSILLDSKVCDVNQTNKVGYTSVMLVSLVEIASDEHANVVRRLFKLADVNVKAKQHGQTALMLAVSHGRLDMVQMLLEAGAYINIQDEDGSTALMCASEHGHIEIVKLFLEQPECDSTISDMDGSTALTIAMEAGHRPIGVLLYTHQRISKSSNQLARS